jgi:hypothetical protein
MATAEQHLTERISHLPPGSFRSAVAQAARRFKSSWVELGKSLVKVRNEALFEEWGYPTFDAYCLSELRIRKATADKLVRSFSFLDKHEPERMQAEDIVEKAPAFEVVEVLAQAEDRGALSAQEYKSVRDSIWNMEKPVSELRREVVEKFPPPEPEAPSDAEQLKRFWNQSKKFAAELRALKAVPRAVCDRADDLAKDLEGLVAKKN